MSISIPKGYKEAKLLTKEYAKTFYFASRFLSREKRKAAYSIYAICRISDNAVDNFTAKSAGQKLEQISKTIESVYDNLPLSNNIQLAFQKTVTTYNIPKQYFTELLDGMRMDLDKTRYDNFDQLYTYCYKAAGVVGLMMLELFGYTDPEAKKHAVDLGIAMQLTNILRDIKEDFSRGRIYLPRDEMERFNLSPKHIAEEKTDNNFVEFLRFQIQRARNYYSKSQDGVKMISDIRSRIVIYFMKDIYAGILTAIERNGYDVFSQRAHVHGFKKTALALKIMLKGKYL